MKSLKNKKSCGLDGISNEMLKHSSFKLKDAILKLFNLVLKSGHFPEIWKENLITPIFKQGEKYDPNNYRGITVSSNLGKLFCSIINDRLVQFIQEHKLLDNCQIGFMPKQRTSDHIYTLHTLIQKHVQQTKQGKIFGCFIDFQKAFDSVWHNGLFLKLIESGIGGRTYDIIKDIYNGNKCCVKINDKRTDYFSQTIKIWETILNHVTCYNYLGLTISASGQFNTAIKDLTDKARRAFYSIRRPLIKFNPPIKLWIKIFDSIIKPILLYGCEIWGLKFKLNYESWDKNPVEIFHLEFCKNILGIHRNAPNLGCRAELGRFPLLSEIQKRAAKFWFHLSDTPTDSYHHSAFTYRQTHPESDPMHYLVEKHQLNSTIRCKHSKVKETETITQEEYIHDWQQKVTQVKKLTYFHSIKSDYK